MCVCVWERDTARLGVDDPQVATVRTGIPVPLAAERVHPVTRGRRRRRKGLAVLLLFDPGWGLDGDQEACQQSSASDDVTSHPR